MITQSEFIKKIGVSYQTLMEYQREGLFLPRFKTPTGKRIFYDEEQVEEFKEYMGLSASEFAKEIGVALSTLHIWNDNGRLVADHTDIGGHLRYTKEQVDKYYAGEYDGIYEDGFIDRKRFAELVGISEATIILWAKKGELLPVHKSITRKWQYTYEQVEKAKKIKEGRGNYYKK